MGTIVDGITFRRRFVFVACKDFGTIDFDVVFQKLISVFVFETILFHDSCIDEWSDDSRPFGTVWHFESSAFIVVQHIFYERALGFRSHDGRLNLYA